MEQVWNGHGRDTQCNVNFAILHSLVWNGGVWNGIRGFDPELWIRVWIEMCACPCSGPFILTGSHIYIYAYIHMYIHTYIYTYIHIYICRYID